MLCIVGEARSHHIARRRLLGRNRNRRLRERAKWRDPVQEALTMAKQYTDRLQRPEWHKWYKTKRWLNRRALQLQKQPLCEICLASGFVIPATVVHHKIPPRGDEQAFFFGELQSLCAPHHDSSAQQLENRGYIRDIGVDGYPVDTANHPFYAADRKQKK